jgi:hypothetical protein
MGETLTSVTEKTWLGQSLALRLRKQRREARSHPAGFGKRQEVDENDMKACRDLALRELMAAKARLGLD